MYLGSWHMAEEMLVIDLMLVIAIAQRLRKTVLIAVIRGSHR